MSRRDGVERRYVIGPPWPVRALVAFAAAVVWTLSIALSIGWGIPGFVYAWASLTVAGFLLRAAVSQGLYVLGGTQIELRTPLGQRRYGLAEIVAIDIAGRSGFILISTRTERILFELVSRTGFVQLGQAQVDRAIDVLGSVARGDAVVGQSDLSFDDFAQARSIELSFQGFSRVLTSWPVLAAWASGLPIVGMGLVLG